MPMRQTIEDLAERFLSKVVVIPIFGSGADGPDVTIGPYKVTSAVGGSALSRDGERLTGHFINTRCRNVVVRQVPGDPRNDPVLVAMARELAEFELVHYSR